MQDAVAATSAEQLETPMPDAMDYHFEDDRAPITGANCLLQSAEGAALIVDAVKMPWAAHCSACKPQVAASALLNCTAVGGAVCCFRMTALAALPYPAFQIRSSILGLYTNH